MDSATKHVLFYKNRKSEPLLLDATDEHKAFLALFTYLDESWECYCDYDDDSEPKLEIPPEIAQSSDPGRVELRDRKAENHRRRMRKWKEMRDLLQRARGGDGHAAKIILSARNGSEYETWDIYPVEDPNEFMEDADE